MISPLAAINRYRGKISSYSFLLPYQILKASTENIIVGGEKTS